MHGSKNATFGFVKSEVKVEEWSSETVQFDVVSKDGLWRGEYKYETEPMFGSSATAENEFVYRPEDGLLMIVTETDNPKGCDVFREIGKSDECSVSVPQYSAETSQKFYKKYCGNPHEADFCPEHVEDYFEFGNFPDWTDPVDIAEERTKFSNKEFSESLVEEVETELLNDGYYVASMNMTNNGSLPKMRFQNPVCFNRIEEEDWDMNTIQKLFDVATELIRENV